MRKINLIPNLDPTSFDLIPGILVKEDDTAPFRLVFVAKSSIDDVVSHVNHLLEDKVVFVNDLLVTNGYEPMTTEETEWLSTMKISIPQPSA